MIITAAYASLLGLFLVFLSLQVISRRRALKTRLGDAGDEELTRAIRAQGNFVEYAPLALLLIGMAELNGAPIWLVHLLGLALLIGRLLHALNIARVGEVIRMRVIGMATTFTTIISAALTNLALAVF